MEQGYHRLLRSQQAMTLFWVGGARPSPGAVRYDWLVGLEIPCAAKYANHDFCSSFLVRAPTNATIDNPINDGSGTVTIRLSIANCCPVDEINTARSTPK